MLWHINMDKFPINIFDVFLPWFSHVFTDFNKYRCIWFRILIQVHFWVLHVYTSTCIYQTQIFKLQMPNSPSNLVWIYLNLKWSLHDFVSGIEAIQQINHTVEKGDPGLTLKALQVPEAKLQAVVDTQAYRYQVLLVREKNKKSEVRLYILQIYW